MSRLCHTEGLTEVQSEIIDTVRTFVNQKILPVVSE